MAWEMAGEIAGNSYMSGKFFHGKKDHWRFIYNSYGCFMMFPKIGVAPQNGWFIMENPII